MLGGDDPDNRHDFPGGFGPTPNDAFTASSRTPEQQQSFSTLKTLLAIRGSHPALQTGEEQLLHPDQNVLVYVRTLHSPAQGNQRVLIAVNKGSQSADTVVNIENTAIDENQHAITVRAPTDAVPHPPEIHTSP